MCDSKVLCVSNQVNNRRFLTQTLTRLGVESDSESVDDSFHINAYQNSILPFHKKCVLNPKSWNILSVGI